MDALFLAGRLAAAWAVALGAGFLAQRYPAAGLVVGTVGGAVAALRRRLPPTAGLAAAGTVALAGVLPWVALAQDPYHARSASSAWPVGAVALAMIGVGAATWTLLPPRPLHPAIPVEASSWERRLLRVALGGVALFLPFSIAGTQIALGITAAILLLAWARGARPWLATALDLPVALLLAAALLAMALSSKPTSPLTPTALRTLLSFYVVTRALWLIGPTDRELGRLLGIWAAVSAGVSLLAFSQHWTGFDAVAALGRRSPVQVLAPESPGHFAGIGTFASRLTYAHATLMAAAVLLGILLAGWPTGWRRAGLWAALALEAAGLWSTFARATWIAAGVVVLAAIALASFLGSGRRALIALGVAASTVALLFAVSPGTRARAHAGLTLSDNHDRLFLWARGAEIALDHPVVGVGFGSYHLILDPYYDRFDPHFPMRTWAHDVPLSLLCETGPIGLFAFLWLVLEGLALAGGAWRRPALAASWRGLALGGALATLALAAIAAFHDVLYDGAAGYNLFFALGLAAWAAARARPDRTGDDTLR